MTLAHHAEIDVRASKRGRKRKVEVNAAFVEAAIAEFAEKGYAGARLSDVAARLGIVRSTIYRYYVDKEDLFLAVFIEAVAPSLEDFRASRGVHPCSLSDQLRSLVAPMARMAGGSASAGVLKAVIGEAGIYPELARIWRDELMAPASELLIDSIADAQKRGEARAGDPEAFALQILSPLVTSLVRQTAPNGVDEPGVERLLRQSIETFLAGVLTDDAREIACRNPGD